MCALLGGLLHQHPTPGTPAYACSGSGSGGGDTAPCPPAGARADLFGRAHEGGLPPGLQTTHPTGSAVVKHTSLSRTWRPGLIHVASLVHALQTLVSKFLAAHYLLPGTTQSCGSAPECWVGALTDKTAYVDLCAA